MGVCKKNAFFSLCFDALDRTTEEVESDRRAESKKKKKKTTPAMPPPRSPRLRPAAAARFFSSRAWPVSGSVLLVLLLLASKTTGAAAVAAAGADDAHPEFKAASAVAGAVVTDPENPEEILERPQDRLGLPLVVHTWPWTQAARAGYAVFAKAEKEADREKGRGRKAPPLPSLPLDAAVAAAERAELDRCDGTVGPGGNTDELGRASLDALVMDGETMRAAGVAAVRVREAAATARLVMEATEHSLLVGEGATAFAHSVGGFARHQRLEDNVSDAKVASWRAASCQTNFRREKKGLELVPDPRRSCGPYRLRRRGREERGEREEEEEEEETSFSPPLPQNSPPPPVSSRLSHDTIAVVAIDSLGRAAAAASSNGAAHKVPGRAGDAAVPGGGGYATPYGGCGSTGDGDLHLRYWPCVRAMASLERGMGPTEAAEDAVRQIAEREPRYVGALVVACSRTGKVGAAAHGWAFSYTLARKGVEEGEPQVVEVEPLVVERKRRKVEE